MGEPFIATIEEVSWRVSGLERQVEGLLDKASGLSVEERKALPGFPGLWKEKELTRYTERLAEAVKSPRISRSRQLLEEAGFASDGISTDVLEQVEGIRRVVDLLAQLSELAMLVIVLRDDGVLVKWVNTGMEEAEERLRALVAATEGFKRVEALANLDDDTKRLVIEAALDDPHYVQRAEEVDKYAGELEALGVDVRRRDESLSDFMEAVSQAYELATELQTMHGFTERQVAKWTARKSLAKALGVLQDKVQASRQEHEELVRRWQELAETLHSLRIETSNLPEGIGHLKSGIADLESKLKVNLGSSGQAIHGFLLGRREFPDDLSKSDVKEALERLRPLILKGLGGE